nr:response regulator [Poseidonocella sedimentorum]
MLQARRPTPSRPLLGLTVLVVEDSRFACEAMRLLCLRSGARIRRADSLTAARRHLQIYRPSVVVVDLGLPDGAGEDLIRELTQAQDNQTVVLGISGDDGGRDRAIEAGADGFMEKPISSLATFQETVLAHVPPDMHPRGPRMISQETVKPDPIAFEDDIAHAAEVLSASEGDYMIGYVTQFLLGVARSAEDTDLADAIRRLEDERTDDTYSGAEVARFASFLKSRLGARAAI